MKKLSHEKQEPYLMLDHYMMNTAAWTALSYKAVWLYLELRKQFNFSAGGDNHLLLPYSKVRWKMSTGTYVNGMRELCTYGFIRVVEPGGLLRRPTVYALSDGWKTKSRGIVDKEGREAIKLGLAKKRQSWNRLDNLTGKRRWEQ
jgi:hypothetical protein